MRCKTILSTVAWLVNECPKGEGIPGWVIQNAGNGSSGLIRLRELAKYCRLLSGTKWTGWAYNYRKGYYYPSVIFQKFCRRYISQS